MSNIGYRICRDFERPERSLIRQFENVPVPNIGDCMNRTAALSSSLQALSKKRMMGTAYTVNCPAGDNLLFYYAIDNAKPGDVIVVANGGYTERALCGEIMASLAMKRGIEGFVIDGAIRDRREIIEMGFPVFAKASIPNGPYKNGPGEINVPVAVGGKVVHPGDIIIGDEGGIVVVKPEEADEIFEKAQAVMKKEAKMMNLIETEGRLDLQWMYDKLAADGVEFQK